MARGAALRHPAVMTLGALALATTGGWLVASVVTSSGQFGSARAGTTSPALLRTLDVNGPVPYDAGRQPRVRPSRRTSTTTTTNQWWVFVGANRSTYRRLVVGS